MACVARGELVARALLIARAQSQAGAAAREQGSERELSRAFAGLFQRIERVWWGMAHASKPTDDEWRARTIKFRKVGPRPSGDIFIGKPCFACGVPFAVGDYATLIPLGPGNQESARAEARLGRPSGAVAIQIHWACATGEEP